MINISWQHELAGARSFAILLPKTLEAIDRWGDAPGKMQLDDHFGPYYDVWIRDGIGYPSDKRHMILRPATLKLGALKALQDAPLHWRGWDDQLVEIFSNIGCGSNANGGNHIPELWGEATLDFMLQLAWFREVMFA